MDAELSICTVKGFRWFRWVGVLHVKFVNKIKKNPNINRRLNLGLKFSLSKTGIGMQYIIYTVYL